LKSSNLTCKYTVLSLVAWNPVMKLYWPSISKNPQPYILDMGWLSKLAFKISPAESVTEFSFSFSL
jgi:hypothetical protein